VTSSHETDGLRVAIDGTSLIGKRTGVGHVTAGFLQALSRRDDLSLVVFAVTWRGRRSLAGVLPARIRAATAPIPARIARRTWPRLDVPIVEHWTGPVDVVHAPNFVAPPADVPVMLTIHDLTFVRHPEMCTPDALTYPRLIAHALDRGAHVHVVSDFVGAEVKRHFNLPAERVTRVYPGIATMEQGDPHSGHLIAGAALYVLVLGSIEPRKNLPAFVRAFDRVAATHPELHLVVAGPDGWDVGAFTVACSVARHRDRIRRLGYVTDAERRDLLAGATAFAYPSHYEGFGHPPLEAMSVNIPVLAGRAGALPEVLDDAALFVDPRDDDDLAAQLDRILTDEALRAELRARGRSRLEAFSWAHAADELSALYHRIA